MNLLLIFIIANIINVVIQTIKSIATVKCGKVVASIVNAVAYGLYTYIVILMTCDLPLITKCIIIGLCNLVGVFFVKLTEEKIRKDRLWKIEFTTSNDSTTKIDECLDDLNIPHNYIEVGKHTIFNCYCATQKDSTKVKEVIALYNAKYFASETKLL